MLAWVLMLMLMLADWWACHPLELRWAAPTVYLADCWACHPLGFHRAAPTVDLADCWACHPLLLYCCTVVLLNAEGMSVELAARFRVESEIER